MVLIMRTEKKSYSYYKRLEVINWLSMINLLFYIGLL